MPATKKKFNEVDKVVKDTLKKVMEEGVNEDEFVKVLHQAEFSVKKTKENLGLMLLSHMIPQVVHEGSPTEVYQISEYSTRIREDFKKGGLFEGLIKKYLVDNQHRADITFIP